MENWSDLYTIDSVEKDKVDWLSDKIQPFVLFQMPDGGWVEFPLGVFIPSSPVKADYNGNIVRQVEAYDGLVILDQDKFTQRWSVPAGTSYEKAVSDILKSAGIKRYSLNFGATATLSNDKEFAMGTDKLSAINDLLSMVNNTPLWVDSNGYFISEPYQPPSRKEVGYTYDTDRMSVIVEGIEEELDLFEVANSWVVTVSNPEKPPLVARIVNNNPDSPTSVTSRGRTIVDFRELEDINSQASLNAYAERVAHEASQVYGKVKFLTPIMPFHEYYDVIYLHYTPMDVSGSFSETNWKITLEAGSLMEHEVRRVVDI